MNHLSNEAAQRSGSGQIIEPIAELIDVTVTIDGRQVLQPLSWTIRPGEHWVVVGPNGCGKSTLVSVAGLGLHPTGGRVIVLGHELGQVDIRQLKSRIGTSSARLVHQLRGRLTAEEIVKCGRFAALEPWWHQYTTSDIERANMLLALVDLKGFGPRSFGTLSSGERQRAMLARSLMSDPDLLLLDEPTAGLDFVGRESLISSLDSLSSAPETADTATVLVTHHIEDIPSSTTHLLVMAAGRVIASGPIAKTLTAETLSTAFGLNVALTSHDNRWSARVSSHSS